MEANEAARDPEQALRRERLFHALVRYA